MTDAGRKNRFAIGGARTSSGSGLQLLSGTSMVMRQARVCWARERLRVGNTERMDPRGGGMGLRLERGLTTLVSMDWTS